MKIWHTHLERPENKKWVLVYFEKTEIPTIVQMQNCVEIMPGCIWVYIQDLLKIKESEND